MKIKFIRGIGFQFYKKCKNCDERFWTSSLFNKVCLLCKYKNSKLFKK